MEPKERRVYTSGRRRCHDSYGVTEDAMLRMMRLKQQAIQSYWIGGDVGNVLKATGLHLYGLHNRLPLRFDVGDRKKKLRDDSCKELHAKRNTANSSDYESLQRISDFYRAVVFE
jgi:hypothetical protein